MLARGWLYGGNDGDAINSHTHTLVYDDDHSHFFLHNERREDFQVHRIFGEAMYIYIYTRTRCAQLLAVRCVPTMFVLRRVPFFVFIHPDLRYFSPIPPRRATISHIYIYIYTYPPSTTCPKHTHRHGAYTRTIMYVCAYLYTCTHSCDSTYIYHSVLACILCDSQMCV